MATPEIVIGASLLSMFSSRLRPRLHDLLIAHIMFCISFVVVVARSRLIGFDRRLEEAARIWSKRLETFRSDPALIRPGVIAAARSLSRSRSTTS